MDNELSVTNQGQDLLPSIVPWEKNALDALQGPKNPTPNQVTATVWKKRGVKKTTII